ncbi:MAG: protein kinase domain-containing protein, partial [Byssovorax sp.]
TGSAVAMGSAEYMSPEQMRSARDVDLRADIWSLGVCLYELCTARGPFAGASLGDTCAQVIHGAPPPPRGVAPQIPAGLEAIILRCLDKDRTKRFASAAELAAALLPFAARPPEDSSPASRFSQPSLPPMIAPAAPPDPSAVTTLTLAAPPAHLPGITPLVLAGMMLVAVMIIGIAFALGRSHEVPAPPVASAVPSARAPASAAASSRALRPLHGPSPPR